MKASEQAALGLSDLTLPAWICDAETGSILSANGPAARFYGYSEAEFSHLKLADLETAAGGTSSQGSRPFPTGTSCDCSKVTHSTRAGVPFKAVLRTSDIRYRGRRAKLMLMQSADSEERACALEAGPATDLSLPGPQSGVIQRITNLVHRLGSFVIAANEDRVHWSAECAELLGLGRQETSLTQAEALAYAPIIKQADAFAADVARCLAGGGSFDRLVTIQTASGETRSIRILGEARLDAEGNIVAAVGAVADVTEIVALEAQASTVARRLELTLDRMNQAFLLVDADCRVIHVNREFSRLMGAAQYPHPGRLLWDVLPSMKSTDLDRTLQEVISTGTPANYSGVIGDEGIFIKARAFAAEGGAAVFLRDASEERSVAQQLALLESAAANTNDMIMVTAPPPPNHLLTPSLSFPESPDICYVNRAFERITGFSSTEAIGDTMAIIYGPQTDPGAISNIRFAMNEGRPVRTELVLRKKDGSNFWVEADIVPILDADGKCKHIVSTQRDISERKRAEDHLRVSEERFELLSRATHDLVRDWNLVDDTVWWNESAVGKLNPNSDSMNVASSWESHIHKDDRERVLSHLKEVLASSNTWWEEEYRLLAANGQEIEVIDRGILLRSESGEAQRLLSSMVDVTERNAISAQLRQSQKLQAVGQLTGGLAHDMNNTLTIVMGNAELLLSRLEDCGLKSEKELAAMIVSASERSAEMMSRLLKVARKHPLEPSPVNLAEELRAMELLLRKTLSESYEFSLVQSEALWLADVDLSQFQSALINMLVNARDAMPEGGAVVIEARNLSLSEAEIRSVPDLTPGDYVKVSVSDTGQGMPDEVRERAFEPFFTTKSGDAGNGLGLSMIYGFMKQSGGHANIYSEPDIGTSISLYFPRSAEVSVEDEEPAEDPDFGDCSGIHVLVVEDHDLVREHVVEMVRDLGFTVSTAASGAEALDVLARDGGITLLFTDVVMPGGMNGPQLAEVAQQRHPELTVLYTSGYTADALTADGRIPDHSKLLTKPYRREELARTFYKVLRGVER